MLLILFILFRKSEVSVLDLWDVVDGGLHAAELWGLDVQHLQDIVGQCVDQVGYAGQRLGGVVLGLLQCPLLVWRLRERKKTKTQSVIWLLKKVYLHFVVCMWGCWSTVIYTVWQRWKCCILYFGNTEHTCDLRLQGQTDIIFYSNIYCFKI